MEFFEVINKRRSIRKFTDKKITPDAIKRALDSAVLAPNSSNAQTWNFYWVQNTEKKSLLVKYCLDQSAARTASDLIVAVASPEDWRRSQPDLVQYVRSVSAPKQVLLYYEKFFPSMYRWGYFNSLGILKKFGFFVTSLFRPVMRGPNTKRDVQEVCIKSTALACENFVLAMTAQGYSTCMMEGFDEPKVKSLLGLRSSDRVVMVIAVGEEGERGTWGPRFRISQHRVVHII